MDTRKLRSALRRNWAQVTGDFPSGEFSEQGTEVLLLAARDALSHKKWLTTDSLLAAILRAGTTVAAILEATGYDLPTLLDRLKPEQKPAGKTDVSSPQFWALAADGPAIAQFAETHRHGQIDSVSILGGLLAGNTRGIPERIGLSVDQLLNRVAQYSRIDPQSESLQFALTLLHDRIFFSNSGFLDGFRYQASTDPKSGLIVMRGNVLHDRGLIPQTVVAEFERLINRQDVSEYDLQLFFEQNPTFLLGYEYKSLHPQVTLHREDEPDLRPDFFIERVDLNFCDIIDLKKPNARLAKHPRNRSGFVAAVYDAIHQLREYRDYFEDASRRRQFYRTYGLQSYRPKVTVIIGRSSDYLDYVQRVQLEDTLAAGFQVLTYDDILHRVRRRQIALGNA